MPTLHKLFLTSTLAILLASGCVLGVSEAWSLSKTLEQTLTLSPARHQLPRELRMLASLKARRQVIEQAVDFLAKQPGSREIPAKDRRALVGLRFQTALILLPSEAAKLSVKAKILADTGLLPENPSLFLETQAFSLQEVERNLVRAQALETDLETYLEALAQAPSDAAEQDLRLTQGLTLFKRYKAMELFEEGLSSMRRQRFQEAQSIFSRVLELDPAYESALVMRGLNSLSEKKYDAALADFSQAIKLRPEDELLRLLYASAATEQGAQPQTLVNELNHLLSQNPGLARAYHLRAKNYVRLSLCIKATPDFKRACELGNQESCSANCRQLSRPLQ